MMGVCMLFRWIASKARRTLQGELRRGLAEGEFLLHYQPLYALPRQEISGFEALIRWRHPERGFVPPSEFIPVAEEIGLIEPIGAWALQQACTDLARLPDHLSMSVNLSPVQFRSQDLVRQVRSAMSQSEIDPQRIVLEITESTLLQGDPLTLRQLHELRGLGIGIAMDDFGTGYSSLSYLLRFPFDGIKIDRSFVGELGSARCGSAIIRAITDIATSLSMTTTAEGVETREQLDALIELGCSQGQGYWWSKPLPVDEARVLCRTVPDAQVAA